MSSYRLHAVGLGGGSTSSSDPPRPFSTYAPRRVDSATPPSKRPRRPSFSETLRENIYTIPNLLTLSRILACPVLGFAIVHDNFVLATALLVYAGLTDLVRLLSSAARACDVGADADAVVSRVSVRMQVDGWMARRFQMQSVLGTILDPAADKTLITTLTVTLAYKDLIPRESPVPLPSCLRRAHV